ncbi:mitochondrial chaperone BCS1, putative [Leishmania panamensis]|uniref:Mitochondrial chaperone BCS1, putative n=1 Tax=Leishmania panamensis TaxID=5679 RepID=A0A088S395_LEIPA|nr:mitochondrial chaperone BCS1, putative [Leishmania panamensis]AIO02684.1 mitochondrial chaperone BCS1, putative [Leishmania panamensis]
MALLYRRPGKEVNFLPAFASPPPDNRSDARHRHGRERRRARQQRGDRFTSRTWDQERHDGEGRKAGASSGPLGNNQVIGLVVAIFLLSALWDFFTAQKSVVWHAIKNSVVTTLEVRSSSQEFAMIVDWMGRQPCGQRIRNLGLKPITVQDEQRMVGGDVPSSLSDDAAASAHADARVMLVPGYGSHLLRFGSTWVYITRAEDSSKQKAAAANRVDRENDKLTLTFFTRRRAVVEQFMAHVQESWRANVRNTVHIYLSEGYGPRWHLLSERIRRPLSTLYLPTETKAVVEEARLFLQLKGTYAALGIPWRRGYLLEGPPGTGKTSFVMALAGELGLPVHILSLRSDHMDDDALLSLTSSLPRRSILLIEDLENVLKTHSGVGRSAGSPKASDAAATAAAAETTSTAPASPYSTDIGGGPRSAMSLSALLNALDGVSSSEGRLLLITTNDTSRIPFAEVLLRPGRIDRRIRFQPLHAEQVRAMEASFQQALQACPCSAVEDLRLLSASLRAHEDNNSVTRTPAQYQQKLLDAIYAFFMSRSQSESKGDL